MNTSELAEKLDCSKQSIYRAQKNLGIPGERYSLPGGGWGIRFSQDEVSRISAYRTSIETGRGRSYRPCKTCGERGHTSIRCPDSPELMTCSICGELKPRTEFQTTRRKSANGYVRILVNACSTCSAARLKECYRNNKRARFNSLLASAKPRAKRAGLPFAITVDWLLAMDTKQHGLCVYSGMPMTMETGKMAYSLDRRDSTKGYTEDNTVLCCWIVNHMKSDLTEEQFVKICKAIAAT